MFEKVLTWLLGVFTQEVLVVVFIFLKIFYLESPNYLLRKPAERLFPPSAASRSRRQGFSERLVPCLLHRNCDTVPLFPLLPHFFLIESLLILILFFPWCFKRGRRKISRKCVLARNTDLPFSGISLNRNQIILRSCTKSFLKNSLLAPCM